MPEFIQRHAVDEEIAVVDRPAIDRECGADDREVFAQRIEQGVGDGADIALGRAVEGRAVLEEELLAVPLDQPVQGLKAHGDGLIDRAGARLEADDDGVGFDLKSLVGHAVELDGAEAVGYQEARDVGRPGEVVGDDPKAHHGLLRSGRSMPAKVLMTALSSSLP